MKILLIAFACEPRKGSEPGVGWNWALHLSRHVDVSVLTRKNNKPSIDNFLTNNQSVKINFIYFDIPVLSSLKKAIPFGVQLYYILWEIFAIYKIRNVKADLVHRLTFVTMVTMLRLYKLEKPYILSFCAGGEQTPSSILNNYSLRDKVKERLRKLYNSFYMFSPVTKKIFNKSQLILAVTNDTKRFIEDLKVTKEIKIVPAIGLDKISPYLKRSKKDKIIYAGSIIYWKNIKIIIQSLSLTRTKVILELYGGGNKLKEMQKLVKDLHISEKILFGGFINRLKLLEMFNEYDLAVHASSHDSGSMFLLEAVSYGVPVLFLNTGGPKEIFSGIDYPLKVNPELPFELIVREFADKIDWFYANYDSFMTEFMKIRNLIIERFNWENKAKEMVNIYKEILSENSPSS